MNDHSKQPITRPAVYAWLILIIIIAGIASVGVLKQDYAPTAATALAATAALIGISTALTSLTGRNKKTNTVLTATSALSAGLALLTSQAETIRQMVSAPELKTLIPAIVVLAAALLTYAIYQYNRENDEH